MVVERYSLPDVGSIWLETGARDPTRAEVVVGPKPHFFGLQGSSITTAGSGAGWTFRCSPLFTMAVALYGSPTDQKDNTCK